MNLKLTLAIGLLTVSAFGALAFMPAKADTPQSPTPVPAAAAPALVDVTQHSVWEMAYVADRDPSRSKAATPARKPAR